MKAKLFFSLLLSLYIIGVNAQRILNGQIEIKDLKRGIRDCLAKETSGPFVKEGTDLIIRHI